MRIISSVIGFMLIAALSSARAGIPDDCAAMLVDAPGSSEARLCLTQEIESLEKEMASVQASIETEIRLGHASFTLQDFQSAQIHWRQFEKSTCWLDAAGAGNSDAVLQLCLSRYTRQRLGQLVALNHSLTGEEPAQWPMSTLEESKAEP